MYQPTSETFDGVRKQFSFSCTVSFPYDKVYHIQNVALVRCSGNVQMLAADISMTHKERDGVNFSAWGTMKFILCVVMFFRVAHDR